MKLNIRGEKTNITEAMKTYAEEKIQKLNKYIENSEEITGTILFKVYGPKQKIEVTIPLKNYTLRVEEEGQDFYAVIDTSVDKLERQIIKNKTRLSNKRNKGKIDLILDFEPEEENTSKIIKRKQVELKPMDEEEAIIQMELLNHDFYMFKNIETDKMSVVYKRKHGDYGIIEE
ncbi:MAG: ribosome hibernation-promoting factor, HPF/YfiA family [Bacilli bacterium]